MRPPPIACRLARLYLVEGALLVAAGWAGYRYVAGAWLHLDYYQERARAYGLIEEIENRPPAGTNLSSWQIKCGLLADGLTYRFNPDPSDASLTSLRRFAARLETARVAPLRGDSIDILLRQLALEDIAAYEFVRDSVWGASETLTQLFVPDYQRPLGAEALAALERRSRERWAADRARARLHGYLAGACAAAAAFLLLARWFGAGGARRRGVGPAPEGRDKTAQVVESPSERRPG